MGSVGLLINHISIARRFPPLKLTEMAPPTGNIPPVLPPSVEEAYRIKCIQLKQRLSEVEEANDIARTRISRITRGIQKSRLERAFLLEQLTKRTTTNVEDSEGSPSPPPTPKEKPLRTKRSHRKSEFTNVDAGQGRTAATSIRQGPATVSPSSDAFSHTNPDNQQNTNPQSQPQISKRRNHSNERHAAPTNNNTPASNLQKNPPKNAFDVYCNEARSRLANEFKKEISNGSYDLEAALVKSWGNLDSPKKKDYIQKYRKMKNSQNGDKNTGGSGTLPHAYSHGRSVEDVEEEDIEMPDSFDPPAAPEISGFTPVNRS